MREQGGRSYILHKQSALAVGPEKSMDKIKKAGVQIVQPDIASMKAQTTKTTETLLSAIPDGKALFDKVQKAKQ